MWRDGIHSRAASVVMRMFVIPRQTGVNPEVIQYGGIEIPTNSRNDYDLATNYYTEE
ncbi:MAG: hypothetical protein KME30_24935 [Iphinoe sp. HA4291-MV1]|jgi:hypothetical protein|nr:hypothetical protein [Iphinoe sp. HA4291-MV1]